MSKDRFLKNKKDSIIFFTQKKILKIERETNKFCMTKHFRFEHMELDLRSEKMTTKGNKKEWRDNDFSIRVKLKSKELINAETV